MSFEQFVCLSGLPRTGSTLLSALLSQNPRIHAEGNSAVCQLMWEMAQSVTLCREQLQANQKEHLVQQLITHIPHLYYQNIPEKVVVDKCRSWTHGPNLNLARVCIDPQIKVIVLVRPVVEIVASFARLYQRNGFTGETLQAKLAALLVPQSEPLMRSIQGVQWAKKQADPRTFLFVSYQELVTQPEATLARIYAFGGWPPFDHDWSHIQMKYPENDTVYGLEGQHEVRPQLASTPNTDRGLLSPEMVDRCTKIDELMMG